MHGKHMTHWGCVLDYKETLWWNLFRNNGPYMHQVEQQLSVRHKDICILRMHLIRILILTLITTILILISIILIFFSQSLSLRSMLLLWSLGRMLELWLILERWLLELSSDYIWIREVRCRGHKSLVLTNTYHRNICFSFILLHITT